MATATTTVTAQVTAPAAPTTRSATTTIPAVVTASASGGTNNATTTVVAQVTSMGTSRTATTSVSAQVIAPTGSLIGVFFAVNGAWQLTDLYAGTASAWQPLGVQNVSGTDPSTSGYGASYGTSYGN